MKVTPDETARASADATKAAEYLGRELGISPALLFGQFAYETGGFTVLQDDFNFGNIKSASGGFVDYSSVDQFSDSYESLMRRIYPNVVNAGDDAAKFAHGLYTGLIGAGKYSTSSSEDEYRAGVERYAKQYDPNMVEGAEQKKSETWLRSLIGFDLVDIGIGLFGFALILLVTFYMASKATPQAMVARSIGGK